MKLLLGMNSWSGLDKIMNDIKRKLEEYDLDETAVLAISLIKRRISPLERECD